jgi:hypothetical protein
VEFEWDAVKAASNEIDRDDSSAIKQELLEDAEFLESLALKVRAKLVA